MSGAVIRIYTHANLVMPLSGPTAPGFYKERVIYVCVTSLELINQKITFIDMKPF